MLVMAGLAQVDWQSLANEAQVRALLEDFVSRYTLSGPNQLALAVWFEKSSGLGDHGQHGQSVMPRFGLRQKSPGADEHKLLMLFAGPEMSEIKLEHQP
jgi:hypothetical protein